MRYLFIIYLVVILLGSVWPFSRANTVLTDNYTLHIRWDYMVHFFIYLPLPVLLYLRLLKLIRSTIVTIDGNIEIIIASTVYGFRRPAFQFREQLREQLREMREQSREMREQLRER